MKQVDLEEAEKFIHHATEALWYKFKKAVAAKGGAIYVGTQISDGVSCPVVTVVVGQKHYSLTFKFTREQ